MSFPPPFRHAPPAASNVNEMMEERLTRGQRAADAVAATMGSWHFIIVQSVILVCWIVLNTVAWTRQWDPYPFILMNLVLSMQAAYSAPVIMMSQNRQALRDRLEAHNDYRVNSKAEEEVRVLLDNLAAHNQALSEIAALLQDISTRLPPREN